MMRNSVSIMTKRIYMNNCFFINLLRAKGVLDVRYLVVVCDKKIW